LRKRHARRESKRKMHAVPNSTKMKNSIVRNSKRKMPSVEPKLRQKKRKGWIVCAEKKTDLKPAWSKRPSRGSSNSSSKNKRSCLSSKKRSPSA